MFTKTKYTFKTRKQETYISMWFNVS